LCLVKFLLIISFAFNTLENLHILKAERVAESTLYEPVRSILGYVKKDIAAYHAQIKDKQAAEADSTDTNSSTSQQTQRHANAH